MKKPNPTPSKPPTSAKAPGGGGGMAPRKSRWGPPPAAGAAGDKAASTSRRTPTPTRPSNARRHPAPPAPAPAPAPQPRNLASPPAAAIRQQPPLMETPPPPPYGFHNLDRRTMQLADGTVRTYFALPPDYPFDAAPLPPIPHFPRAGPEAWPLQPQQQQFPQHDGKRRHPDEGFSRHPDEAFSRHPDEGFSRQPKQARFEPPPSQMQQPRVDRQALRKAFLKYSKMLNENPAQKRGYLEGGRVQCLPCGRSSKDFADVHGLVIHAYNPPNADSFVDHLGLHKALCVLMGWDYTKVPDNSKAYQSLPPDLVRANREDLIIWPPTVIIRNTATGRKKDGRSEGLGNKEMDKKIAELGFAGGKSKSLYGKEGHLGLTLVKFANNPSGLKEADRLAEFLERQDHGRVGWSRAQATRNLDPDTNPLLVETDNKGEKKRILYGSLAISSDLDELDSDSRKRATVKSRKEFDPSD